jgi:lipopolysaccharide/colanic/teichoic acid biosynthesis glycosyltransferase
MGKFYRKENTQEKKKKAVLLFFKSPSDSVLSRINDYLDSNNFENCGYYSDFELQITLQKLGSQTDFQKDLSERYPNQIIVIGTPEKGEVSQELLIALKLSQAVIKLIPVNFDLFTGLLQISSDKDLPHIRLYPNNLNIINKVLKYITNKSIAMVGLTMTLLLMPIIATFIKLTSKGPVFYKQKRLGKNAKPFYLYKFRTMIVSAEENGPQLSSDNDQRITPAGKILRYWHIDELPQFWNVFKGEMALVGPRPERPYFAKVLSREVPYYKIIYQEKPGLTSLWMIKFGYASSLSEMTDRLYYDIVYLNNPSFLMDLKILANTLRYIFLKTFYDPSPQRRIEREAQIRTLTGSKDPLVRWLSLKNKIQC